MRIARLRALTHFSRYLLVKKGAVEMSIARLRALTQHLEDIHFLLFSFVEMRIARLRALTQAVSGQFRSEVRSRNENRPIKGIDTWK